MSRQTDRRTPGVDVLLLMLLLAAGIWLGWTLGTRTLDAERARFAQTHQRTAEAAHARLEEALKRGNLLTTELESARARARAQNEALHHEVVQVTDERACLREPALRVLDRAIGLRVELPATAGGLAAADADRVATDTQLAGWAIRAGEQYAECNRRLKALIDWHGAGERDDAAY